MCEGRTGQEREGGWELGSGDSRSHGGLNVTAYGIMIGVVDCECDVAL